VGVSKGSSPGEAAAASVRRTQFPLLGATVIGLLAFAPISLSADASGYFLRSLFDVVAISLLLSWILATTVVPLLGSYLLKAKSAAGTESEIYAGPGYAAYRGLLEMSLRRRWVSCIVIFAITGTGLWGFGFVKQGFFPPDRTPLFYVDYLLPQGTDILTTAAEIAGVESLVEQDDSVVEVASFIGMGMSRFSSTVRPEQPNPAMAQLVVRVQDVQEMSQVMARTQAGISALTPQAQVQTSRSEFTPAGNSKIEARFSGPDPNVLRGLADKALGIYLERNLIDRKTDWRQHELEIVPEFNAERARLAGVSRADVYQSLAFATHGVQIGLFRDKDKLLPIIGRAPLAERSNVHSLTDRLVWSPTEHTHIPMSHVVSSFTLRPQDSRILRRQRIRTISALANAPPGHNVTQVFNRMRSEVEAIPLPPGYSFEWGGEYEATQQAERLIFDKVPLTFGIMFFITVLMFGNLRQPIVIWLTVPMVVCGVVLSLLITDMAFTFTAFLGLLSLSGMLIKNCVVLVDEIDKRLAEVGHDPDIIIQACISRLRPVTLATGTTIAGISPLLTDPFFAEMAVCIMGGLAFATLLTLIAVPVFYRLALGNDSHPASSSVGAEAIE
jgi:multidrug efflux pump subunit AcrB